MNRLSEIPRELWHHVRELYLPNLSRMIFDTRFDRNFVFFSAVGEEKPRKIHIKWKGVVEIYPDETFLEADSSLIVRLSGVSWGNATSITTSIVLEDRTILTRLPPGSKLPGSPGSFSYIEVMTSNALTSEHNFYAVALQNSTLGQTPTEFCEGVVRSRTYFSPTFRLAPR